MTKKCSVFSLIGCIALVGCAGTNNYDDGMEYNTPTVDYIERLDVNDAPHKDSFLNQLALNYRSYAIYNAKTSGYPDIGELFAQKAVSAFSGETPFPENLDSWQIEDDAERYKIYTAYNDLMGELKDDAAYENPQLAAEAQAKFDCWISAAASGQNATAQECKYRFNSALKTLSDCSNGKIVAPTHVKSENVAPVEKTEQYYPETHRLNAMSGSTRTREGVIIVNNVNVPANLINPVPVPQQPMVFNQNIYGGTENIEGDEVAEEVKDDYVTREEFINMMMTMRSELAAINKRLDDLSGQPAKSDTTVIKVQQIPLEPKQHIMEEIFEIRFDFDKSNIKPEYEELIRKLAATTQANKNVKVSVVGHTDTSGSSNYNYALGGRRAEAVQKMLIEYGIPSSQIVAVSAGEEDLKVQTPNNTPNAENRRVRVVKEVHYTEQPKPAPIVVEEYSETDECSDCEEEI
ncbi:MAG: OmpA family protein [Alphaproteobacteria bacterium]|nr:OmpA family protein [Alphaproteobacteria bacterium]